MTAHRIHYSDRYSDDHYEYRHVILPKPLLKLIPKEFFDEKEGTLRLLTEAEWRGIGITQSLGWQHYEVHGLTCFFFRFWDSQSELQPQNPMSSFSVALKTTCHLHNPKRLLPGPTPERNNSIAPSTACNVVIAYPVVLSLLSTALIFPGLIHLHSISF